MIAVHVENSPSGATQAAEFIAQSDSGFPALIDNGTNTGQTNSLTLRRPANSLIDDTIRRPNRNRPLLSAVELKKWASQPKNQPPKSWYDDTTNPFKPAGE